MNAYEAAPGVYRAMLGWEAQINHCGFCLGIYSKEARAHGESEQRLDCLEAWREAPFYTDRERAALAWTEAVTVVTDGFVPDSVFNEVRPHFSDAELTNMTLAIVSINGWNRFSVAFRAVPGTYRAPEPAAKAHLA